MLYDFSPFLSLFFVQNVLYFFCLTYWQNNKAGALNIFKTWTHARIIEQRRKGECVWGFDNPANRYMGHWFSIIGPTRNSRTPRSVHPSNRSWDVIVLGTCNGADNRPGATCSLRRCTNCTRPGFTRDFPSCSSLVRTRLTRSVRVTKHTLL